MISRIPTIVQTKLFMRRPPLLRLLPSDNPVVRSQTRRCLAPTALGGRESQAASLTASGAYGYVETRRSFRLN